jgi:hypothetical protein
VAEDRKVLWFAVGAIVVILSLLFFSERVQRELRADPIRAHVAIQVEGDDHARTGRVEIPAGTEFELHAVLEASGRGGQRLFFTEAPALVIDGERFDGDSLRGWPGPERAKVLWFSVEGPRPFVELPEDGTLSAVRFQAVFRPDWPRAWSIPGSIRPAREAARAEPPSRAVDFGTQRFHVRIELFGMSSNLVPVDTYSSTGVDQLLEEVKEFPTVAATLPGSLAMPSRVFGLSQIDLTGTALEREATGLRRWFDDDLAFSKLVLLRGMVDRAGIDWDELEWTAVDLSDGPIWSEGSAAPGDLLRAGERVVVLFEDHGAAGRLDYDDLCLDFLKGPTVRPLREVFSGEGLVERTAVGGNEPREGGT